MEFLLELLLQLAAQAFLDLGFNSINKRLNEYPSPWLTALGCIFIGLLLGALTLLAFPSHFVKNLSLQLANLAVTPIVVGACSATFGRLKSQLGLPMLRVEQFWFAYVFALSFALARFVWAN
jgi:formate hydrogenlyase subunit 4